MIRSMKVNLLKVLAVIGITISFYVIFYYLLNGIGKLPTDGDSIDYHIPIAHAILNGTFLNARNFIHQNPMRFLPGSSEAILAIWIFLRLPINDYNILTIIVLFFSSWAIARSFSLKKYFALLFAVTVCMLHGITRWLNAQVIDIWLLSFFLLALTLVQKPKATIIYFLSLGFVTGMLVGTKITGPLFFIVLLFVYGIDVIKKLRIKNFFAFFIPFSVFGLFWYIRNLIDMGNPFYPQPFLFFKGYYFGILDYAVWRVLLFVHNGIPRTINAVISEYTVWSLVLVFFPVFIGFQLYRKKQPGTISKLLIISFLNLLLYLPLPSGPKNELMVSSLRYSYPAFIPLILCAFIIAKENKKEELIGIITICNMLFLPELSYHPKLLFAVIPFGIYVYYFEQINKYLRSQTYLFFERSGKFYSSHFARALRKLKVN